MFDIWLGDINLTWFVIGFAIVVVLPIQLFLCFKVKSLILRLVPIVLSAVLMVISIALVYSLPGLDGLLYVFLAIYGAGLFIVSAVGWAIWKIAAGREK